MKKLMETDLRMFYLQTFLVDVIFLQNLIFLLSKLSNEVRILKGYGKPILPRIINIPRTIVCILTVDICLRVAFPSF